MNSIFTGSLIVIGCSAGGFDALKEIIPSVPFGFSSTIVIVLHLPAKPKNRISEIFAPNSKLEVKVAEDKEFFLPGRIYFAPSGYHLLIEANRSFSLSLDEPVQFSRPSIDVLFESAAVALKRSVVAMVLSGANEDGALGVKRVLECGGKAIVQDPKTAQYSTMPEAAYLLNSKSSHLEVMNLSAIADLLGREA